MTSTVSRQQQQASTNSDDYSTRDESLSECLSQHSGSVTVVLKLMVQIDAHQPNTITLWSTELGPTTSCQPDMLASPTGQHSQPLLVKSSTSQRARPYLIRLIDTWSNRHSQSNTTPWSTTDIPSQTSHLCSTEQTLVNHRVLVQLTLPGQTSQPQSNKSPLWSNHSSSLRISG